MKNFTYTARDRSGATKRGSLKAADRNAAMQELTAQGMVPLSLAEGQSIVGKSPHVLSRPSMIILLAAGTGLLIGLVIWLRMTPVKPSTSEKTARKEVQAKRDSSSRSTSMKTNAIAGDKGNILDPLRMDTMPPSRTKQEKTLSGTDVAEIQKEPKRPMDYPSGLEQVINWIVNKRLGDTPFFLPRLNPKESIAEILDRDLIVYDDDTEDKIQAKANVAQAKQMLKEYIAQGGKPEDFLNYFHTALLEANREWKEAQKQVSTLMQSGEREAAVAYAEEANKRLAEKGIKPIISPR